jgi:hypothetical protein
LSSDFQCSGFIPVKDALLALNLFVKVPKAKLAFKEDQDVLSGSYSWKESTTARPAVGHDAFGTECKESFPLLLPSMNALTWKFERVCQ